MPIQLSERVKSINQSASIAAKNRVTELQAQGRDIVDFTLGEPDLNTPAHIVDAAAKAMRDGDTHYTSTAGVASLRALIAEKMMRDSSAVFSTNQVIVGSGAKQIINQAFMATLNPGDEVIIPAPYWVSYPDIAKLAGGVPVTILCSEATAFKLDPASLQAAITPKTRWLVLNSPNNPSGAVYSAAELAALAKVLDRHPHVMIMTDDIYEDLVYDGHQHVSLAAVAPGLLDRTLLISGFSKGYAMTGWRVGYAVGPVALIGAIAKLIGQSTTCASSISQAGAVAALSGPQDFLDTTRGLYVERRNAMHAMITSIAGVECPLPEGAFYLFPNVTKLIGKRTPTGQIIANDVELVMYLLDEADTAVMDGTSYGLPGYLRLSYATSLPTIERGCLQIKAACERLS